MIIMMMPLLFYDAATVIIACDFLIMVNHHSVDTKGVPPYDIF
jgi:hypothetical protein